MEQNQRNSHELRYRVAIRFAIAGDLRFISHHDTMRLFERALARARLPVKFSQGFNPRPRLSLPLPRPVGIASDAELLVVDVDEPTEPGEVLSRLAEQAPGGLSLVEAWPITGGRSLQAESAEYILPLGPGEPPGLAEAVARLRAAESWPVQRSDPGQAKTVDLRAWLADLRLDDGVLRWTARMTSGGSIRPGEVLAALGLDPYTWHHHVRRASVKWSEESQPGPADPATGVE